MVSMTPITETSTYYEILGVAEDASKEDIIKAYRQKALTEHPDKGGDKDLFDELVKAYKCLEDATARSKYDADVAKERERHLLVEGAPINGTRAGTVSSKQAQEPMARQKTAPTAGSKRQGNKASHQPGRPGGCSHEWAGIFSGAAQMKMIKDGVSPEVKANRLLEQYAELPRGKEKKREWTKGLRGKDKANLKDAAKIKEAEARADPKLAKWLANGPTLPKKPVRKWVPKAPVKKEGAKEEASNEEAGKEEAAKVETPSAPPVVA